MAGVGRDSYALQQYGLTQLALVFNPLVRSECLLNKPASLTGLRLFSSLPILCGICPLNIDSMRPAAYYPQPMPMVLYRYILVARPSYCDFDVVYK